MGVFDFFTGDGASGRADQTIQYALLQQQKQGSDLANYNQKGLAALDKGFGQAQTQYGQQQAGGLAALSSAYDTGQGALNQGAQQAQSYLDPYAQAGGAAQSMYTNALGLNGAAGNAAATGAFQAGPGYEWQVNQATDAAARNANKLGMAYSGNTVDAITRLGSNLANQEWGSYLDRLNSQAGMGAQVAGQQSSIANGLGQGLASLGQTYGQNTASMYGKGASDLANLDMQNAIGGAGLWTNLGNQTNALNSSTLNAVAAANKDAGAANQQGSSNLWGAVTGLFS